MTKLTEAQERERASWQFRAIQATKGNQTRMGRIVLSLVGRAPNNPPWCWETGTIGTDGNVYTFELEKVGDKPKLISLGSVQNMTNGFRWLCDELKFADADREALFGELRKWIASDFRAINDPDTVIH